MVYIESMGELDPTCDTPVCIVWDTFDASASSLNKILGKILKILLITGNFFI